MGIDETWHDELSVFQSDERASTIGNADLPEYVLKLGAMGQVFYEALDVPFGVDDDEAVG